MVFTMTSSAMPPPLRSNFSTSHTDKKGGFTLQARQDTVPRCSVPCIQNAIAKVTDCHFTDYACACKYHGKVSGAASACVVGSCGLQRAVKVVVPAIQKLCEQEALKDVDEKEEKVERELEALEEEDEEEDEDEDDDGEEYVDDEFSVYNEEFDEYDEEFDEYEDDEEKKEEQAKRQLIVPDEDDMVFEIDPVDADEYDEEEEEEE
ncbi:hypothetical protein ACHAPE_003573 [Trichoderma viride]